MTWSLALRSLQLTVFYLSCQPKKKIRSQNEGNLLPEVLRLLFSIFNLWPGLVTKLCPTLADPWTVVCQAPLSVGFPRQVYWNRLPFPSPGDLPDPGMNLHLLHCRQILYQLNHKGNPFLTPIFCLFLTQVPERLARKPNLQFPYKLQWHLSFREKYLHVNKIILYFCILWKWCLNPKMSFPQFFFLFSLKAMIP